MRFPVEIVRRVREAVGPDFILIYRLSMLDLIEGGRRWDEVVQLAKAVEAAGATILNTGIGWHEARIPTIATSVPRAAFAWVTQTADGRGVGIPLVTTNRINTPEVAERLLADGYRDMVSLARPLLADPEFVDKAARGPRRRDQHLHRLQPGLPRPHLQPARSPPAWSIRAPATRPSSWIDAGGRARKRVAVVGAGPAGLACADHRWPSAATR